jgi:hypothetical protein
MGVGVPWFQIPESVRPLLSILPFQVPCMDGIVKLSALHYTQVELNGL